MKCICGIEIEFNGDNCGNIDCLYKLANLMIGDVDQDNKVIKYIKENQESSANLIFLISESTSLDPKPDHFSIDDVHVVFKKENRFYYMELMKKIIKLNSDIEIICEYGEKFYYIMRYFITSTRKRIITSNAEKEFNCYKIYHEYEKENEFEIKIKNSNYCYLFHGSPIGNWYSILANDLQVYSGTSKMTTGQAYGPGIYLSDNYNTSNNYSKGQGVLGVYQVVGLKETYKKTQNIYVIPNKQLLILRYIIINGNMSKIQTDELIFNKKAKLVKKTLSVSEFISTHFNDKVNVEQRKAIQLSNTSNKRLMKEYQNLLTDGKKYGINVLLDNENLTKWFVQLYDFPLDTEFYKDFIKLPKNKQKILLEIEFEKSYPFKCPFIRVITPRFCIRTAHITSGGSICLESLTPSGWSAAMNIESVLIQIKTLIIEGNGRIDFTNQSPYQYSMAKQSFEQVARAHNWI